MYCFQCHWVLLLAYLLFNILGYFSNLQDNVLAENYQGNFVFLHWNISKNEMNVNLQYNIININLIIDNWLLNKWVFLIIMSVYLKPKTSDSALKEYQFLQLV